MFSWIKKEPPNALDAFIRATYGESPPTKSANFNAACTIAHKELLLELVSASEVSECARQLFEGPIPYSTHDLAAATSLNFFKRPELWLRLQRAQAEARKKVAGWATEGKIVQPFARSFEAVLQRNFGIAEDRDAESRHEEKGQSARHEQNEPKAPLADSLKEALVKYFEAAVKECNRQFGEMWTFDPDWVDLLGVANDLDKLNGNEEKMEKIREAVMKSFLDGDNVDKCVSSLLVLHLSNQRQLEEQIRRSGKGKMFFPK